MQSLAEDRHGKALRAWRRWELAKYERARRKAVFELAELCEPEIWRAATFLAERLGKRQGRHITVVEWLWMHEWTREEVFFASVLGVYRAAEGFDPNHYSKASFQTYAYKFILGALRDTASSAAAPYRAGGFEHEQCEVDERVLPQATGTWKKTTKGGQVSIPGGTETSVWTFDRWRFLELDPDNGDKGKRSDQGGFLDSLDVENLNEIREWLEENKERAIEAYGLGRWCLLHFSVSYESWVKRLPPDARHTDFFARKQNDELHELPLQGATIRTDGKKWNLDNPIRAEIREQQGKRKRQVARQPGMPWSTYKDMRKRTKKRGFSLDSFTLDDLDAIARGSQGSKPDS